MSYTQVEQEALYDLSNLKEWMKGDYSLILEVLESFQSEIPPILAGLVQDLADENIEGARFAVHKLRSSLELVSARPALGILGSISADLEQVKSIKSNLPKATSLQEMILESVPQMIQEVRSKVG